MKRPVDIEMLRTELDGLSTLAGTIAALTEGSVPSPEVWSQVFRSLSMYGERLANDLNEAMKKASAQSAN